MKAIPYSKQTIEEDDLSAVMEALQDPLITQGNVIPEFEKHFTEYTNSRYATAICNGTAGLTCLYKCMDIGPGKTVWTVPITFLATANAALHVGGTIDFVDIDRETWNLSIPLLKDKLLKARSEGNLPSLVVPVHFGGLACDMEELADLAHQFKFKIVEDAAHALGGCYKGELIGTCKWSAATLFSFHPVKAITTGEGGVVVTNDEIIDYRMKLLRSHGITRDKDKLHHKGEGDWYYEQQELGWNLRLTDFQAALGISQLKKVNKFINSRRSIAERYTKELSDLGLHLRSVDTIPESAHHLFVIHLADNSHKRKALFDLLRAKNILVNVHYIPAHIQPYYKKLGFHEGMFPNSEYYYNGAISLPIFPTLSEEEQDYVIETLASALPPLKCRS